MARPNRSAAAYTLIDLSDLPDDIRKEILDDANVGGGAYGVRIVEESINGGARAPIYGVYNGDDADRWATAKEEFGIKSTEVDDSTVLPGAGVDPAREAALREAAAQRASAQADAIRAGEDAAVAEVTGDTVNIVDTGLDPNATNEAANAKPAKPAKPSKTPR